MQNHIVDGLVSALINNDLTTLSKNELVGYIISERYNTVDHYSSEQIRKIANAIKINTSLKNVVLDFESFSVSSFESTDDFFVIIKAFANNKHVHSLKVNCFAFTPALAQALVDTVNTMKGVQFLDLSNNRMNDDAATVITEGLCVNTHLKNYGLIRII